MKKLQSGDSATEETAATTPAEAPVAAAPATETPADTTGTSAAEETAASTATSDTVTSTYQAEQSQTPSRTYSAPAAPDYAGLAVAKSENAGLQPQTAAFKEEVANLFGITSFSGYRPGDSGDHGKGLAIDFMVPVSSALGIKLQNMQSKIWLAVVSTTSSGNNVSTLHMIVNMDQPTRGINARPWQRNRKPL